jgi:hypothetical protein
MQLFDLVDGRWLEFEALQTTRSYVVAQPQRYVDESGRLMVRFVNRGGINEEKWFAFAVRLEGTIE